MRPIDGDALKERLQSLAYDDWNQGVSTTWAQAYSEVADMIDDFPSADVREVKRGRWIPVDSYSAFGGDEATWMAHGNPVAFYYCSECKEQTYAGEDGESLITDYCPFCGADMRKEE